MSTIHQGTFHVFTFKDGLLARLAHDLRLTLERYEIELEQDSVKGRFWPESLKVDGAMRKGRLDAGGLSANDKRKIHGNITTEILHTRRHPEVELDAKLKADGDNAWWVDGTLKMLGRSASVRLRVEKRGGQYVGQTQLTPSHWGIAPYKALGGAIKLQDRLKIAFELSAP